MSNGQLKTSCPACNTVFVVTDGQLKIADGLVRCGSCLNVFNAAKHAVAENNYQPEPPLQAEVSEPLISPINPEQPTSNGSPQNSTPENDVDQVLIPSHIEEGAITQTLRITETPVELNSESLSPTKKSQPANWLYMIAVGFFTVLLVVQLFWFKQDKWQQSSLLRPVYATVYELQNKALPHNSRLDLITNQQMIIQPHEEFLDAIRISLLLENTASFRQPFPTLRLVFSDIKGRPVAQRTLSPKQYIDPTLFPQALMPVSQPIQIQLDMMTPGRRAVSYQVILLPATPKSG